MVYLLHDHIAGVQPIFRTVSPAVPDYLAASLLQPAEAPGKGGLASPVITNDAYNAAGWNSAILYVKDCRFVGIRKAELLQLQFRPCALRCLRRL